MQSSIEESIDLHISQVNTIIGHKPDNDDKASTSQQLTQDAANGMQVGILDIHRAMTIIGKHSSLFRRMRVQDVESKRRYKKVTSVSHRQGFVSILLSFPPFSWIASGCKWLKDALFHPETPEELQMDFMQWLTDQTHERAKYMHHLRHGSIAIGDDERKRVIAKLHTLNEQQAKWIIRESPGIFRGLKHRSHSDISPQELKRCTFILSMLKHQLHALKQQERPDKANHYLAAAIRSIDTVWSPIINDKTKKKQSILDYITSRPIAGPAIVAGLGTFTMLGALYILRALYSPGIGFAIFAKVLLDIAQFGSFLAIALMYRSKWNLGLSKTASGRYKHPVIIRTLALVASALLTLLTAGPLVTLLYLTCVTLTRFAIHPADRDNLWPNASRRLRHFIQASGRPKYLKGLLHSSLWVASFFLFAAVNIINYGLSPWYFFGVAIALAPGVLVQSFTEEAFFRSPLAALKNTILGAIPYTALHPNFRSNHPRLSRLVHWTLKAIPIALLVFTQAFVFGFAHFNNSFLVSLFGWSFPFIYVPIGVSAGLSALTSGSAVSATIDHWLHNLKLFSADYAEAYGPNSTYSMAFLTKNEKIEFATESTIGAFLDGCISLAVNNWIGKRLSGMLKSWKPANKSTNLLARQTTTVKTAKTGPLSCKLASKTPLSFDLQSEDMRKPPKHRLFDHRSRLLDGLSPKSMFTRKLEATKLFDIQAQPHA